MRIKSQDIRGKNQEKGETAGLIVAMCRYIALTFGFLMKFLHHALFLNSCFLNRINS
jgi:hypothetical protein